MTSSVSFDTDFVSFSHSIHIVSKWLKRVRKATGGSTTISSFMLIDICWYFLIVLHISWLCWSFFVFLHIPFVFGDICSYLLIFGDICWCLLIFIDLWWYLLMFVDICWSLLIFVDVCSCLIIFDCICNIFLLFYYMSLIFFRLSFFFDNFFIYWPARFLLIPISCRFHIVFT